MKILREVTHRHITAKHYLDRKKYMVWVHLENQPYKTVDIYQVRGIKEPLTEKDLTLHIDKIWAEYKAKKEKKGGIS